jgi:hypothetical protein
MNVVQILLVLTENFATSNSISFNRKFWQPDGNEFFYNKHCVLIVTNKVKILLTIIINFTNCCFVIRKF